MERIDSTFWEVYLDLVDKVRGKELDKAIKTLKTYILFVRKAPFTFIGEILNKFLLLVCYFQRHYCLFHYRKHEAFTARPERHVC